jgi:hypothetical protein
MLAGDYEHDRDIPVRPRVLYDRIHDRVDGDAYSRMLAVSAGGTIPDKGLYTVRTENGVKLANWMRSSSSKRGSGQVPARLLRVADLRHHEGHRRGRPNLGRRSQASVLEGRDQGPQE